MRKELEEKLARRWPSWFGRAGNPRSSPMAWGFEHGDGWFNILWRLCVDLEPMAMEIEKETGECFLVLQVKEKLGTLRFYIAHHTPRHRRRHRRGPTGVLPHLRNLRKGAAPEWPLDSDAVR
jgi:hypothetical protein